MTFTTGNKRFQSEIRQQAGLMLVLAFCCLVQPSANIVSLTGAGTTANEGIPLSSLIGGLSLALIGVTGLITGYAVLVHDWGTTELTGFLIAITQLAFIPYITDMTNVGKGARSDPAANPFIPLIFEPTETDVRFVGTMGILGILAYGFSFVGSLAFMEFSIFSFQAGKPESRNSSYYAGRLGWYSMLVGIAGLSQLMLGAYITSNFGSGPLEAPVTVAMYIVHFPGISIFVGAIQLLNSAFGLLRYFKIITAGPVDYNLQYSLLAQWLFMIVLQIYTQIGYAPGNAFAPAAPTQVALTLGLSLLPAYLDFKSRTTPEEISPEYYGLANEKETDLNEHDKGGDLTVVDLNDSSDAGPKPASDASIQV